VPHVVLVNIFYQYILRAKFGGPFPFGHGTGQEDGIAGLVFLLIGKEK
jgi:hypothetical protein